MTAWSLIDTLNLVSVFFLTFFALFLLTHRRGKPASNRILAFFLLSLAFSLLNFVLSHEKRLGSSFMAVFLLGNSFDFLLGPLFYFYVGSVARRDISWRKSRALHALPLAVYLLFLATVFTARPSAVQNIQAFKKSALGSWGMHFFGILISLLLLGYLWAGYRVLKSYRTRIKGVFSSLERVNLGWLNLLMGGFGLIWFIGAGNYLQAIGRKAAGPSVALSILNILIIFGMANIIVFKGLKQPEIFLEIEEKVKYAKSQLTSEEADRLLARLKDFMENEKPYLIPGLTIGQLGRKMAASPRHLSQVINSLAGQNFMDFINAYRIGEAKRLLSATSRDGRSILEIAFEVGFNSKSVFNAAFKKHAGVPPRQLKKLSQAGASKT